MRLLTLLLVLAAAGTVCAGPDLDRVIDYPFLDQTVPYKNPQEQFNDQRRIRITKDTRIGQTFVTGPETGRIARIRVLLIPTGDWQKGECAELTVWDSPERKVKLGSVINDYDNRNFHYFKFDFTLPSCEVSPNTSYYFEITYAGEGDGKLGFVGAMDKTDAYAPGQGYLNDEKADFDLCFQIHSKPAYDRIGNLKKMFARLDLDRPGLEQVKTAVEKEDFEAAIAATVAYFESRTDPFAIIDPDDVPSPKASDFIAEAGELMNATWRDVDMEGFGAKKIFTIAYLSTGEDKYAKKINDLMIEWFVGWPPPGQTNIGGTGWDGMYSSLSTGLRIGHGFVAYSRLHTSPTFTTDCRLAYIINLADSCKTLVKCGANAGGNWSFTQNSSMLTFAMNFPEFKESADWRDTAIERLTNSLKKDILPDGAEMESAFSYQRMAYNPLANVYADLILKRGLKTPFAAELGRILERQAEYFMYAPMPNGITPYMGDWAHGDMRGYLASDAELYKRDDMLYVATAGKQGTKPKELSKLYPNAGVVTMRSDWGDAGRSYEDARYLLLHGVHAGAHGHEDINSIPGLYAYGRELLTDPGSHEYGSDDHNRLGSSISHNLLTIDAQGQTRAGKTEFRWWSTSPVADYVSSYQALQKTGDTTREILYARSNGVPGALDYWVVRDIAGGSGTHSIEQRWHFVLDCGLKVDPETLTARTTFPDKGNLSILQVDPSRLSADETTIDFWGSRANLDDPPSKMPTVIYKADAALPAAVDTLLVPFEGPKPPEVKLVTIGKSADGLDSAFKVTQGDVVDLYVFQRAAGPKALSSENMTFDGERLIVRRVGGKVRSVVLVNGTTVRVDGKEIVKLAEPEKCLVVDFSATGRKEYRAAEL